MKIFVNEKPVEVPQGASALESVRMHDRQLAERVQAGGYLTDGVGREIPDDTLVGPGMIIRAVGSARRQQTKE